MPTESTTIHCEGCGMQINQDLVDGHTCNTQGALVSNAVAQTKTPEDWTADNEIRLANKKL